MNVTKLNPCVTHSRKAAANIITFRGKENQNRKNIAENPFYGYSLSACTMPKEVLAAHLKRQEASGCNKSGVDPIYDSFHDSLSGLRNKEYLMCRLPILCQDAIDVDDGICVAMFDMDNFKSINQFLGYSRGDEFIQEIGKQIKKNANNNDIGAYRYGGEEFVIVFKNSDTRKAKQIAEEVLKSIKEGKLSAYVDEYKKIGTSQLVEAKAENALISNLSVCYNKSIYTKELLEKYYSQSNDRNSKFADFLENERVQSNIALINAYETIIQKACCEEKDAVIADKLAHNMQQLKVIDESIKMYYEISASFGMYDKQGTLVDETLARMRDNFANIINEKAEDFASDKRLYDFLCARFSRKAEVIQYRNWLNSLENLGNFTITCGIKQFYTEDLLQYRDDDGNFLPEKIVDKAGNVLKHGKAVQKGQVYVEHSF